jgi:Domain of unknown function (DUF4397)
MCRWLRNLVAGTWLSILMVTVGCGGGSGTQAQLRVLMAAPNEPTENVLVDSTVVSSNLGYGANTGYLSVNSGQRHLQVEPTNSTMPIVDQTLSVSSSTETTVIVNGLTSISGLVLTDNNTAPASGTAMVRVVNMAPSMGPADVYVVPAGSSLTGLAPTVSALAVGAASSYQSLTIPTTGTTTSFEVLFTEPGTSLAFLTTGALSLSSGQIRTVVALNSLNGGFSFATLADLN